MPRLLFRPLAKQDLTDIWDYIAVDNADRAENVVRDIYGRLGKIAHNPYMGRARPEIEDGLRSFSISRYVAFYSLIQDGIEVIRILHGSRDLEHIDFDSEGMNH